MVRSPDGSIDEHIVKEKSAIYAKNSNNYQKAINNASFDLCFNNPSLLLESKGTHPSRNGKEKIHEDGYCYKKSQTRSKVLNPSTLEDEPPQPKHKKINAYERQRRIKELNDELSGLNRHVRIKEQRLEQATASRNFKVCDELASEISELKSQWQELSTKLAGFQLKSKAAQYQSRKNAAQQHDEHSDSDDTTQSDDPNLSPSLPTRM